MSDQKLPVTSLAGDLKVGDWVFAPSLDPDLKGLAEVLFARPFHTPHPGVTVLLSFGETSEPVRLNVKPERVIRMATALERDEVQRQAERAKRIADIRQLADWLESHPYVPMPWATEACEHLNDGSAAEALAKVREVAAELGVKTGETLDDRTEFRVHFGHASYHLVAWHKDGRPADEGLVDEFPGPEPVHFGYDGGDTVCGLPSEGGTKRQQVAVWRDVTCHPCIDAA